MAPARARGILCMESRCCEEAHEASPFVATSQTIRPAPGMITGAGPGSLQAGPPGRTQSSPTGLYDGDPATYTPGRRPDSSLMYRARGPET
eukprot:750357-Hanusia_phi.AAC.1